MSRATSLSFPGGGYAHAGTQAFGSAHGAAHGAAHASQRAVADSGALEPYGYDGFPGNPLLAAGLAETRAALLLNQFPNPLGVGPDLGGSKSWGGAAGTFASLPNTEQKKDIAKWGAQPVAALAQLELLSSIRFNPPSVGNSNTATLEGLAPNGAWADIASLTRPPRSVFEAQLTLVEQQSTLRDSRAAEIFTQVSAPIAYYAAVLNLQAGRHRNTLALINAALEFAYAIGMRFKHALACPRPSEYSFAIQAMIEVPRHATLPSGHATEGHVMAGVFIELLKPVPGSYASIYLRRLAYRVAFNRTVAGLHFPVDNMAGRLLGDALAGYFLSKCGVGGGWIASEFDGTTAGLGTTVMIENVAPFAFTETGCSAWKGNLAFLGAKPSGILQQMWTNAAAEWQ